MSLEHRLHLDLGNLFPYKHPGKKGRTKALLLEIHVLGIQTSLGPPRSLLLQTSWNKKNQGAASRNPWPWNQDFTWVSTNSSLADIWKKDIHRLLQGYRGTPAKSSHKDLGVRILSRSLGPSNWVAACKKHVGWLHIFYTIPDWLKNWGLQVLTPWISTKSVHHQARLGGSESFGR